jgi:hypothetical protein
LAEKCFRTPARVDTQMGVAEVFQCLRTDRDHDHLRVCQNSLPVPTIATIRSRLGSPVRIASSAARREQIRRRWR